MVLVVWWAGHVIVNNSVLLPGPSETMTTLVELLTTDKFQNHVLSSVGTLTTGWLLCLSLLLISIFAMLASRRCKTVLTDLAAGWQGTPTFAMAPIIILAFGYTLTSVLVLLCWAVVWYGVNHLAADIARCQDHWQTQAANLDWRLTRQFFYIYVPALAPSFGLIAKNSWSMMWRTLIALEILFGAMGGSYGLGSFMNETRQQLLATETWSTMIVILVLLNIGTLIGNI
jgi:NitT/TauT family transport system permease protein